MAHTPTAKCKEHENQNTRNIKIDLDFVIVDKCIVDKTFCLWCCSFVEKNEKPNIVMS